MKNGFKQYGSLVDVVYVDSSAVEPTPKKEVDSPIDRILKVIFSKDENGWPSSSVEVMLSEKTSEDVRKFIQDNLFSLSPDAHAINDDKVVAQFKDLKSDFIAMASRNRFESIEDYESRLNGIMEDFNKNQTQKDVIQQMRERFMNGNDS